MDVDVTEAGPNAVATGGEAPNAMSDTAILQSVRQYFSHIGGAPEAFITSSSETYVIYADTSALR